jgi:ribosomal protein S18 acetylase RimI-like enzyme
MIPGEQTVKISPFEDCYAGAFKSLNLEWLEGYNLYEPSDLKYLDYPRQVIIEPGGDIFLALINDTVVGTVAILKQDDHVAELAKLAVVPDFQGRGIGGRLVRASVERAREMGFQKIVLVSNTRLKTAVHLYESMGFIHAPVPENTIYETADVYMEFLMNE